MLSITIQLCATCSGLVRSLANGRKAGWLWTRVDSLKRREVSYRWLDSTGRGSSWTNQDEDFSDEERMKAYQQNGNEAVGCLWCALGGVSEIACNLLLGGDSSLEVNVKVGDGGVPMRGAFQFFLTF